MALGATFNAEATVIGRHANQAVRPAQFASRWFNLIDAGGLDGQDAANITDPDTEITDIEKKIVDIGNSGGTMLLIRAAYDDGLTGITDPVVHVFGRTKYEDEDGNVQYTKWQTLLTNESTPARTATVTLDTTNDDSDGTLNYTTPDYQDNAFDLAGCNQVLVGVETALAATGTVSTAYLQGKII